MKEVAFNLNLKEGVEFNTSKDTTMGSSNAEGWGSWAWPGC
jgi:hypothetical protein